MLKKLFPVYFPWQLFWKFFVTLLVLLNLMFLLSLGIASYVIDFRFYSTEPLIVLMIFFLLSILGSAAFAWRFTFPMGHVILKALKIANKKTYAEYHNLDDVLTDEPGEYFELEMALDKIRRQMKRRRIQLSIEREETQALMSSLQDAIASVDLEMKVQFYNARFANQFMDHETGRQLTEGKPVPLAQIFREPEVLEVFEETIREKDTRSTRLKLQSKIDGLARFFSVTVSPLVKEKDGEVYGALALFHDISDLKKAEQIRMEFVENASHELRTPLTSVKGFVETLREDVKENRLDQLPYFLEIISRNVTRLSDLVNDMLTLSRLESSNSAVKREIVHPENLAQDVVERMASLASEKNISIKVLTEAQPFSADQRKAEQVLQNLIGNAIKYIPEGGHIEVRWEEQPHATLLRVIDDGPGIAEIHLNRLFERFYRIDKGRTRDAGGTGLGLSIVKHIMQSHGGTVTVKSDIGKGSEFICIFPK
jgi:two-component system phosphate regulon sensor histidine kinase PhoR